MKEYEYTARLMGCVMAVSIIDTDHDHATEAYNRALSFGRTYEARFTRFDATSELSYLNTAKHAIVSKEYLEILLLAQMLHTETNGVFNALLQISALGYTSDFNSQADKDTPSVGRAIPYDTNFSHVLIEEKGPTVTLTPTQRLDFGGFLKGHVAQMMAQEIGDVMGVVVNIGGDIYTRGTDVEGAPFTFSIFNPVTDEYPLALPVTDSAIATSGTYRRHWGNGEKLTHHILDIHGTANPRSDVVSATVIHPEGARADAYATVAIVLGSVDAVIFLEKHAERFVLITQDGSHITNT